MDIWLTPILNITILICKLRIRLRRLVWLSFLLIAAFAPLISPYDPYLQNLDGRLIGPVWGEDGKITAEGLCKTLSETGARPPHHIVTASMSLTQATENGTVYSLDELSDLTAIARDHGLKVHMDGARFANAVASLGCSPAEMTWGSGIDALTFGMTKNGAIAADALVFFDTELAESVPFFGIGNGLLTLFIIGSLPYQDMGTMPFSTTTATFPKMIPY